jgi:hypothetical protein
MATETELTIKKLQDEVIDLRKRLESMLSRKGGYIAGSLSYEGDLQPQRSGVSYAGCVPVWLTVPLTSAAWDDDAHSTTAKTLIDLSAVFGVPAGVRAIDVKVGIYDTASLVSTCYIILAPNDTAEQGKILSVQGLPSSVWRYASMIVPCNADGDIYYQIAASGANTLHAQLEIWSYWL